MTAGLKTEREPRPCLDGDPVTFIPFPCTAASDLPPDLTDGPALAPQKTSQVSSPAFPTDELVTMPIPVGTAPARAQAAAGPQLKTGTSEEDPLLDAPPSSRTPSAAAPLEVSDSQLPPAASAASGAEPAAVSGQGARLRLYRSGCRMTAFLQILLLLL